MLATRGECRLLQLVVRDRVCLVADRSRKICKILCAVSIIWNISWYNERDLFHETEGVWRKRIDFVIYFHTLYKIFATWFEWSPNAGTTLYEFHCTGVFYGFNQNVLNHKTLLFSVWANTYRSPLLYSTLLHSKYRLPVRDLHPITQVVGLYDCNCGRQNMETGPRRRRGRLRPHSQ